MVVCVKQLGKMTTPKIGNAEHAGNTRWQAFKDSVCSGLKRAAAYSMIVAMVAVAPVKALDTRGAPDRCGTRIAITGVTQVFVNPAEVKIAGRTFYQPNVSVNKIGYGMFDTLEGPDLVNNRMLNIVGMALTTSGFGGFKGGVAIVDHDDFSFIVDPNSPNGVFPLYPESKHIVRAFIGSDGMPYVAMYDKETGKFDAFSMRNCK